MSKKKPMKIWKIVWKTVEHCLFKNNNAYNLKISHAFWVKFKKFFLAFHISKEFNHYTHQNTHKMKISLYAFNVSNTSIITLFWASFKRYSIKDTDYKKVLFM